MIKLKTLPWSLSFITQSFSNCNHSLIHFAQLQRDVRKNVNDEKREAQRELDAKREKAEKAARGRGKGRGRGRGKGRGRKAADPPLEEQVPGMHAEEALDQVTEEHLRTLRNQRSREDMELEARGSCSGVPLVLRSKLQTIYV